jgi:SAM-dependent methyltransferase
MTEDCGRADEATGGGRTGPGEPSDYRKIDFESLWRNRQKVIEVERQVLRLALGRSSLCRTLEVGTGVGRLAGLIRELSTEFVASDLTLDFLRRLPREIAPDLRVCANVNRLPFVDGAFSCVVMIRVHNFLPDPVRAFREIARVLSPGGRLVFSYNPKPSAATVVDDAKVLLHRERGAGSRSMTLDPSPRVRVRPSQYPAWISTRAAVARTLAQAGLRCQAEFGTGFEDYRGLRRLPAGWFVRMSERLGKFGGFPTRFSVQRKEGTRSDPLPTLRSILACPRCRARLPEFPGDASATSQCPSCGWTVRYESGIFDLRFETG